MVRALNQLYLNGIYNKYFGQEKQTLNLENISKKPSHPLTKKDFKNKDANKILEKILEKAKNGKTEVTK